MCKNIKTLFNFEPPVTDEEIRAASLQFVKKISGFHKPSKINEAVFLAAAAIEDAVNIRMLQNKKYRKLKTNFRRNAIK